MTMGDRIVVMKNGYIQQIDTPTNLYRYPANMFVAGFIGTPPMNFYDAKVYCDYINNKAEIIFANGKKFETKTDDIIKLKRKYADGTMLKMGVRPESFEITQDSLNSVSCKVKQVEILGSDALLYCDFDIESDENYDESKFGAIIKTDGNTSIAEGDIINVKIKFAEAHFFDAQNEICVSPHIIEESTVEADIQNKNLVIGSQKISLPEELSSLNGRYTLDIPLDAICEGNMLKAEIYSAEKVKNGYLTRLKIQNNILWCLLKSEKTGLINIDIDFTKIDFYKNGNIVKGKLSGVNTLDCCLIKRKTQNKEHNSKFYVDLIIGDAVFNCSNELTKRLLGASSRKIFDTPLKIQFKADEITAGNRFHASVKKVIDYGKDKYALCEVMGKEIYLCYNGGNNIDFDIDIDNAVIYDGSGIRL
jgi:hypothetical protein